MEVKAEMKTEASHMRRNLVPQIQKVLLEWRIRIIFCSIRCINYEQLIANKNTPQTRDHIIGTGIRLTHFFNQKRAVQTI